MKEDAEERNNTDQKERESDKEGKVPSIKCCREVRRARRGKKEVTGFDLKRVRECFLSGTARGGNQPAAGSGMKRR